jgi:hypothetical protein
MNDRKHRIKEISSQIQTLTKELESLLLQEDESDTSLSVGDKITITNNHLGLRGATGTVVGITKTQYRIKLDNGSFVHRGKQNVVRKDDRTRIK